MKHHEQENMLLCLPQALGVRGRRSKGTSTHTSLGCSQICHPSNKECFHTYLLTTHSKPPPTSSHPTSVYTFTGPWGSWRSPGTTSHAADCRQGSNGPAIQEPESSWQLLSLNIPWKLLHTLRTHSTQCKSSRSWGWILTHLHRWPEGCTSHSCFKASAKQEASQQGEKHQHSTVVELVGK